MKIINIAGPVISLLLLLICTSSNAQVDKAQAQKDWTVLAELLDKYQRDLTSESYLTEKGEQFVQEWQDWSSRYETFMQEFAARYGSNREEVRAAFEGIQQPLEVSQDIGQLFGETEFIDVAKEGKRFADMTAGMGREAYGRWDGYKPEPMKMELKLNYAERALKYFSMARALDPAGSYDEFISKAETAVAQSRKEWEAVLPDLKWPGHNPAFAGPGDPDDLAEAALAYLKSADRWSKPEYDDDHIPVAACVTGKGYEVSKKAPVTQEPTQYSLNVFVAFKGTRDPDIAYGYNMVFYTAEKLGIEQSPPFMYANSRQYEKYKMLMANVQKGGARSGASSGSPLMRLLLGVVLLLTGLAASGSLIVTKVPQLASVCNQVTAYRAQIGIAALVIGILSFLKTFLFNFAPLADLIPQLAAVILGVVLGKELLMREKPVQAAAGGGTVPEMDVAGQVKEQVDKASQATRDLLKSQQERIALLEKNLVMLGLAGLAAGLVHLLLGGLPLF